MKFALVVFAVTVTLAGTVAAAVLLLESATTAPLAGAGPLSVTVPCDVLPPVTVVGFRLTPLADTPPPPPPDPNTWNSERPMFAPTAWVTVNFTEVIDLVANETE